jgi:hypothetical protein
MFRYKQTKRKPFVCRHDGDSQCRKTQPLDGKAQQLCERCKEFECKVCKKVKSIVLYNVCIDCEDKECGVCGQNVIYNIPHPICDIKLKKSEMQAKIKAKVVAENKKLIAVKDNDVYPNGVIDVIFEFSLYTEQDFQDEFG